MLPCPAITSALSKGLISARPRSCAMVAPIASRSSLRAVVQHHLGPIGAGVGDLHLGRVRRHDDHAGQTMAARGQRHPLRVVARGIRDHAFGIRRQRRDCRPAAAKLEAAGPLQTFRLDQNPPPGDAVQQGAASSGVWRAWPCRRAAAAWIICRFMRLPSGMYMRMPAIRAKTIAHVQGKG